MADEHESKSVDAKVKYEELGRNYRAFLDWREKIVGGYVTVVGLVGIGFYKCAGDCFAQVVLLFAEIVVSIMFWILNVRNSQFLHECVEGGRRLESGDGVYRTLDSLRPRMRTHGLALGWLQAMVIGASALGILRERSCWFHGECLSLSIAVIIVCIVCLFFFCYEPLKCYFEQKKKK
jgi:hypothetical protein